MEKLFLVGAACVRKRTAIKKVFYRIAKIIKIFDFVPFYNITRKVFYKFILRKSDYPYVSGIMKETYLRVVLEDLSYYISFVKVPTVIIWGSKDESTPMEDAQLINQKITRSKLVVIPEAPHALQIKVPEVLSEKILENLISASNSNTEELLSLAKII